MWGRVSGCLSHVSPIRGSCSASGHALLIVPHLCVVAGSGGRLPLPGVACGSFRANQCGVVLSGLLAVADGPGSLMRLSVSVLMD